MAARAAGFRSPAAHQDWDRLQRVVPFQLPSPAVWANVAAALAGIVTVLILVGLAALVIGTIARYTSDGALMAGVDEVERTGTTSFNSGLRAGWSRMLRLFVVDLLIGIGALFLVLPIVVILLLGLGLVIGPAVALGVGGSEGAVAAGVIWGVLTFIVWLVVTIAVCAAIGVALTLLRSMPCGSWSSANAASLIRSAMPTAWRRTTSAPRS